MAANANLGQRSDTPSESDGLMQQTQEQIVNAQGKLIEAVRTIQEPVADALRKTLAITGDVISTSQRIVPFDRLLEIQLDLVHKLFDVQVGLANMIFEAQSDLMELPRRVAQNAGVTSSHATDSNMIDLRSSRDEHPAGSTTR